LPIASPKPAVHKGAIKAVAIATPGITLLFSFLVPATIRAKPPIKATNTSHMEGDVRANNSDCASCSGVPIENHLFQYQGRPIIGLINGEMSIAPIITAVEFTFNPIDVIKMANIKVHRFAPLKSTFFRKDSIIVDSSALSSFRLNRSDRKKRMLCKMFFIYYWLYYRAVLKSNAPDLRDMLIELEAKVSFTFAVLSHHRSAVPHTAVPLINDF